MCVIIKPPGKKAAIFCLSYGTCLSSCRVAEQLFSPRAEKVRDNSAVYTYSIITALKHSPLTVIMKGSTKILNDYGFRAPQ